MTMLIRSRSNDVLLGVEGPPTTASDPYVTTPDYFPNGSSRQSSESTSRNFYHNVDNFDFYNSTIDQGSNAPITIIGSNSITTTSATTLKLKNSGLINRSSSVSQLNNINGISPISINILDPYGEMNNAQRDSQISLLSSEQSFSAKSLPLQTSGNVNQNLTSNSQTSNTSQSFLQNLPTNKTFFKVATFLFILAFFIVNQRGTLVLLKAFLSWVESMGVWGNFMFAIMFFLISFPFILVGYTPLTLGAGAIYGVVFGTITVSLSSTLGACLSFYICRRFCRTWIHNHLVHGHGDFETFLALFDQAKQSRTVSFLARLSPVPFGLQNSFFAMTDIHFQDYLWSTWLGLLPFQILWTHFGTTLHSLSKISSGEVSLDFYQKLSLIVQVIVAIGLFGYFYFLMKKLKQEQRVLKLNNSSSPKSLSALLPTTNSQSEERFLLAPVPNADDDIEMGIVNTDRNKRYI